MVGFDNFVFYFGLLIVFLFIFKLVYVLVIFYDEWKLVKEEKNVVVVIGFGGVIIGFVIVFGSVVLNLVVVVDFVIWVFVVVIV